MLAVIALVVQVDLLPSRVAAGGSLKMVAFPDGGTLEIIGTSVGGRVVEISPVKRFKVPFLTELSF